MSDVHISSANRSYTSILLTVGERHACMNNLIRKMNVYINRKSTSYKIDTLKLHNTLTFLYVALLFNILNIHITIFYIRKDFLKFIILQEIYKLLFHTFILLSSASSFWNFYKQSDELKSGTFFIPSS